MKNLMFLFLFSTSFNYLVSLFYYERVERKTATSAFKMALLLTSSALNLLVTTAIVIYFTVMAYISLRKKINSLKIADNG